ncbi:hypothetical protein FF098_009950 [Parvularcula flava]|uniref:Uncharacterized protein n=1 Tax=Aquisalinus luteolus TaxID=1566827 RepID=A0A8J3EPI0_9PROT|nr:hypothetical protein [Aquisalinus luteolus]NHK28226.1 hypothetical protein [Aquisalinus luteolus]GGH97843.1 hypothetical protein GCM10011355_20030 [Aquisalinus luteolus]
MQEFTTEDLRAAVNAERLSAYARLRGGFPIPLAGATYWAVLGIAGYFLDLSTWSMIAFFGSGSIFPLALLYAKIFRNDFMKSRTAVGSVILPAMLSMLLFWAFIVVAAGEAPSMIPLILAVGMSIHWPVIGWSYGRTALFSAHAVLRAIVPTALWFLFPDERLTWLPLSVSAIYLATIVVIFVDSGRVKRSLGKE